MNEEDEDDDIESYTFRFFQKPKSDCNTMEKLMNAHLTRTERSFSFRQMGELEQEEIRNRIRRLYL